jgi:molybdenum cofactor cytidylyltransferase
MGAEGSVPIAGVVLAAGASTRMGANKLLLEIRGETLLHRAVRAAIEAGLEPVLVVLGHEAERARAALGTLPCRPVLNPDPHRGLGSSVATGIAALPPEVSGVVVLLADMPGVTAAMLAALSTRHRATRAPLVLSDYDGVVAPPVLYDRRLFPELAALDGEGAGRAVIERHRAEAIAERWPAAALQDVDVPSDLARLPAEVDRS